MLFVVYMYVCVCGLVYTFLSCGSQIAANLLDRAGNSSQLEVAVSFLIDSLNNFL